MKQITPEMLVVLRRLKSAPMLMHPDTAKLDGTLAALVEARFVTVERGSRVVITPHGAEAITRIDIERQKLEQAASVAAHNGVADLLTRFRRPHDRAASTPRVRNQDEEPLLMKYSTLAILILACIVMGKILLYAGMDMTFLEFPGLWALLGVATVLRLVRAVKDPK